MGGEGCYRDHCKGLCLFPSSLTRQGLMQEQTALSFGGAAVGAQIMPEELLIPPSLSPLPSVGDCQSVRLLLEASCVERGCLVEHAVPSAR